MDNWKAIAYLLASGQGLLLTLALLTQVKKTNKSNMFLGLILFVLSLELLNAWGMQVNYHSSPGAFPFWILQSYLMLPPAIWLFFEINTNASFVLTRKHLFLFIPACIDIAVQTGWSITRYVTGENLVSLISIKPWFLFAEILPVIGMVGVLYMSGRRLVSLRNHFKILPAPLTPVHMWKLYSLFTFLVLLTVLWIAGVLVELPIFTAVEFVLTLFLFALGYMAYFNPALLDAPKFSGNKPTAPAFINYNDQKELSRLNMLFEEQKLHTRSKLSLEEVAAQLKLPTRYVSYLINTYHTTNFHYFVNAHRVQEVIRKINDPAEQHKTLLALALESGFNSKSSFNQVFKAHTGQSPSDYLVCHK